MSSVRRQGKGGGGGRGQPEHFFLNSSVRPAANQLKVDRMKYDMSSGVCRLGLLPGFFPLSYFVCGRCEHDMDRGQTGYGVREGGSEEGVENFTIERELDCEIVGDYRNRPAYEALELFSQFLGDYFVLFSLLRQRRILRS